MANPRRNLRPRKGQCHLQGGPRNRAGCSQRPTYRPPPQIFWRRARHSRSRTEKSRSASATANQCANQDGSRLMGFLLRQERPSRKRRANEHPKNIPLHRALFQERLQDRFPRGRGRQRGKASLLLVAGRAGLSAILKRDGPGMGAIPAWDPLRSAQEAAPLRSDHGQFQSRTQMRQPMPRGDRAKLRLLMRRGEPRIKPQALNENTFDQRRYNSVRHHCWHAGLRI